MLCGGLFYSSVPICAVLSSPTFISCLFIALVLTPTSVSRSLSTCCKCFLVFVSASSKVSNSFFTLLSIFHTSLLRFYTARVRKPIYSEFSNADIVVGPAMLTP